MWIVRLALRRPLSVAVMALLMLVLGVLSFAMMNVDIFPAINLPVVILIYNYPGLSAVDMARRIVLITERAYSLSVNDIQHIESESIEGLELERVYFQPGTDIGSAIAQLTATSLTVATLLPRGTEPPAILSYNAANVPVAQLNVYSDTLSGQQLFDYAFNFIRLRVEVDLPNQDSALYPGMYATVVLNVSSADDTPFVPDDALIFRGGEGYLPIVRNGRINLATVILGNDDGREVEIARASPRAI
jgi:hypothetical protein